MSDVLAFLAPAAGVPARSPLATAAQAAGATLAPRDGWEVAVGFGDADAEARACRETVAWADASPLRKHELQGPAGALAAVRCADGLLLALTPERALVLGADAAPAFAGVHVVDVTAQLAALRIGGPLARELFACFCALDLRPRATPPGALRPGSVARTPGLVLCEAPDRYLLLFGAAFAEYVWEVVGDAGVQLGGRPVGAAAFDAPEQAAAARERSHA